MKKFLLTTCLLICAHISFGQSINVTDSLQIREALLQVFRNFEKPNYDDFSKISSEVIYCSICDSRKPKYSSKMSRRKFYRKNLKEIAKYSIWDRASKSNGIILFKENVGRKTNQLSDITAFITVLEPGEYAPGHEGGAIGIQFKKIDGEFKFSGIETVP
ncbi:hypothetical protein [Rufibacter immobilis]|uniref:hypothetical protein n=1 Tax=Rufibacter immobilis TaxID=1348778 RepID=UPI0035E5B1CD